MTIKYLRPPRLQNLTPANQTLLTGTRSCSSPHISLTLQAHGCMKMPKVIQIFRRNQSASDVCFLLVRHSKAVGGLDIAAPRYAGDGRTPGKKARPGWAAWCSTTSPRLAYPGRH